MAEQRDWIKIKNEYISGNISYRDLAEKHDIPFQTLRDRATREKWFETKKEVREKIRIKTAQKTIEKASEIESNRIIRVYSAAEKLLGKVEEATEQLNNHLVKNKKKTKVIEYNNSKRPDKPTKEIIDEIEEAEFVLGDVDRVGLKLVVGALKDLKDIISDKESIDSDSTKSAHSDLMQAIQEATDEDH